MEQFVSYITLGVNDIDNSRYFYENCLNLPGVKSPPGVNFFSLGQTRLAIWSCASLAAAGGLTPIGVDSLVSVFLITCIPNMKSMICYFASHLLGPMSPKQRILPIGVDTPVILQIPMDFSGKSSTTLNFQRHSPSI